MLIRLLRDVFGRRVDDSAESLYAAALACLEAGDREAALAYCLRTLAAAPGFADAWHLRARITLPGEPYYEILERILAHLRPRTYVEIGVSDGSSLQLARAPIRAIGIDPAPQLAAPPAPNQEIFAETSDEFFARHDLRAELGGLPVDVGFIDGMHLFEYALRDFSNLERYCDSGSVILIHDCHPLDRSTAERTPNNHFWSGDVWRLIVLLAKYRPDLRIHTIAAPPTGLGIVRNLDPGSRALTRDYDRLCAEFLALDYAFLDEDKPGKLRLVPNEWPSIEPLLPQPRVPAALA